MNSHEQIAMIDEALSRSFEFGENRALSNLHVYYQADQKCYLFSIKINTHDENGYLLPDGQQLLDVLSPLNVSKDEAKEQQLPAWGTNYPMRNGKASSTILMLSSERPESLIALLQEKGGLTIEGGQQVMEGLQSLGQQVAEAMPRRDRFVEMIEARRQEAYQAAFGPMAFGK